MTKKSNIDLDVKTCYEDNKEVLDLKLLNNKAGLKKLIEERDLSRPALLLTGFTKIFANKKIQLIGNTEYHYLMQLSKEMQKEAILRLVRANIPCLILSNNYLLSEELLDIADEFKICIFSTSHTSIQIQHVLYGYLGSKFAPKTHVHGTLVDVYGVGILFTGRSGIGKSEIALDLVERGHRLVADDVVELFRDTNGILVGRSRNLTKNMLEIRGVGLIDIWNTFGIRAVRLQKRVEVEVVLEDHRDINQYDRLGDEKKYSEYLDVSILQMKVPIFPGKNITVISEVIALKTMARLYGFHPEKDFMKKLNRQIKKNGGIKDHLIGDSE